MQAMALDQHARATLDAVPGLLPQNITYWLDIFALSQHHPVRSQNM